MSADQALFVEVQTEQSEMDRALAWLRDEFQIADEWSLKYARDQLLNAKSRAQALEERRKAITAPIRASEANVNSMFKPLIDKYGQAEEILKAKIAAHTRAVEDQRRAAMQASAAEYQAGGTPTAIIPEPVRVEGVTVTQVWDFEITDPNMVPRDLCSPDDKKVRAYMTISDPPKDVPGIRFFQRDRVAARTGRTKK